MDPSEALAKARELVSALARRRGEVGRAAAKVLALLDHVEAGLRDRTGSEPVVRQGRKGLGPVEYRVEMTPTGGTLAEHRTSGASQPFRCPKTLYDAVIEVLAKTDRAMSVDEVASAVEVRLGERPADFQLRVPLRLWMHVQPPLLTRSRARYRAATPEFGTAAVKLWNRLK